ncbi:hypothetical protein GJB61_12300 [Paenibacillus sp. LC-T2]|uniref:Uncharacterized protein n=1 Tax=Paenibacillus monticola TaxID=2666075 RepID=A0A7X2H588_9BACL|nr:hypothetical protein [Paenibacillus monticola]MRN53772.1 hypothetical protein [Paenibacillus monticola]
MNEERSEPLNAWNEVALDVFGESTWAQRKSCSKNAFLGLCEVGIVKGIVKVTMPSEVHHRTTRSMPFRQF